MSFAFASVALPARAHESPPIPHSPTAANSALATERDSIATEWFIDTLIFFLPDEENFAAVKVGVDTATLHLEARSHYDDRETAAFFAGRNLGFGSSVRAELTAMVGALVGNTTGGAPGYDASLAAGPIELTSEGLYVFTTLDTGEDYFSNWSELTCSAGPLWFGGVAEQTKAVASDLDEGYGVLLGVEIGHVSTTAYLLDPAADRPTWTASVEIWF